MTPEVKSELAELRAKVRELTADLKDEQRQKVDATDPAALVQGEDEAMVECDLEFHWQKTFDAGEARTSNRAHGLWTVTPTWNQLLKHLGPELMDEASEDHLRERLSDLCLHLAEQELIENVEAAEEPDQDADKVHGKAEEEEDERVGRIYTAEVRIESFNDIKVQFSALGLITKGVKRRLGSDQNTYWLLTERGHQELLRLRAIRRSIASDDIRSEGDGPAS